MSFFKSLQKKWHELFQNASFQSSMLCLTLEHKQTCAGILKQSIGTRNRVGIGLWYRPDRGSNLSPTMGAGNQEPSRHRAVGTGPPAYVAWLLNSRLGSWNRFLAPKRDLSFRLRLHRLAELIPWNRFLGSLKV
jgi:hypothetical protein